MARAVIPRMALLEAVIVVEVAVAPIVVATINHTNHISRTNRTNRINRTQATAIASNLPTGPRIPHPTPAPLPSPVTPNLNNRHGTPSMDNIPRRTHRTLLCPPRITTRTMPLKYTSSNRLTAVNPPTNRLPNLRTVKLIRLRDHPMLLRPSSGEPTPNNLRPTVHMVAAGVAAAAATMIAGVQRGR
jgi:hypothetical protein